MAQQSAGNYMIDREVLLNIPEYAQPYQKEKDYIEELFLSEIYGRFGETLVFKGGTALSKFYNSDRFSDDLDFSLTMEGRDAETMSEIIDSVSHSYPTKTLRALSKSMLVYELSIRGPLFETSNKYQHLKLEIDRNARVLETPSAMRRNPAYPDLKPYVAAVMRKEEILAEKVVTLLFRRNIKARDLYDLYFIIKTGISPRVSLIDKKMKVYGHTFTVAQFERRIVAIGKIWDAELRRLLPEDRFVSYSTAKKLVAESFAEAGLL